MQVDPAASLRCWALEIDLGGRTYEVPALPAADWLPVLLEGDPLLVLDMFVSIEDGETIDDLILAGQVKADELTEALIGAVEQTAGRPFMASYVLVQATARHWATISGRLSQRGFRWDREPLGAALDAVYSIITMNMKDEDRVKFEALLDTPMPGRKVTPSAAATEGFELLAGPKPTGGVRASGELSGSGRPRSQPRHPQPHPGDPLPAPTARRAPRARNGPRASSGPRSGAAGPASGTGPPPPR
jgi:hypothetical protein